jgi:hypothetical protein
MRQKSEAVLAFEWDDRGLPKVVREYRAKYLALSQVLVRHPEILDAVDKDLKKLSTPNPKGRKGDYTSENLLRALVVMAVEGLDYRETVIRIGGDVFLQGWCQTSNATLFLDDFEGGKRQTSQIPRFTKQRIKNPSFYLSHLKFDTTFRKSPQCFL